MSMHPHTTEEDQVAEENVLLKIYGVYVIHKQNNLEVGNACSLRRLEETTLPYLSTLISVCQDILKKDMGEETTISFGTDLFQYFIGENIIIVTHTERKISEKFTSYCKELVKKIEKDFPILKSWDGERIGEISEYLNNAFEQKFSGFKLAREVPSLEDEILNNPCENIDAIERAHQLFLLRGEFQKDKIFLGKCADKMEKIHADCYEVPRVYAMLGWVFNYLLEFEMAYNYFERAIENAFKIKEETLKWPDEELIKNEKNKRIKNSAIALADANYGLTRYYLTKNDFIRAIDSLRSAKEELEYLEEISRNIREIDFELAHAILLESKMVELEKEFRKTKEAEKKFKRIEIQKITTELENVFNNLKINIEEKIKETKDETIKIFYKEKLIKVYGNWGSWLRERESGFNEEFNRQAIEKYEVVLQLINETEIKRHRGMTYNNIAQSYAVIKDFEKSKFYLNALKKVAETDRTLISRVKICDLYYNIFYHNFKEKDSSKILDIIGEINDILEKEEKYFDKDDKIKLHNLMRKAIEFLNTLFI